MTQYRTRQEIFNVAYRGLASQGFRQSMNSDGCAYRGDNNTRCAIGWCIPDDLYLPELEDNTPGSSLVPVWPEAEYLCEAAKISRSDANFACALQRVHDADGCSISPKAMQARLQTFARAHRLTIPEGFDDLLTAQEPEAAPAKLEPAQ